MLQSKYDSRIQMRSHGSREKFVLRRATNYRVPYANTRTAELDYIGASNSRARVHAHQKTRILRERGTNA
jgi:hypothetical protein